MSTFDKYRCRTTEDSQEFDAEVLELEAKQDLLSAQVFVVLITFAPAFAIWFGLAWKAFKWGAGW